MPSLIRFRVQIRGRVQKVFFRHTAKKIADSLGLSGWVKNDQEEVICEVQGERLLAEQFLLFALRGPRLAEVSGVAIEVIPPLADEDGFVIVA